MESKIVTCEEDKLEGERDVFPIPTMNGKQEVPISNSTTNPV